MDVPDFATVRDGVLRREPESVTAFIRLFYDRVWRSAWRRCGDYHDAWDLTQEVFARAISEPGRAGLMRQCDAESCRAWLLTILRNIDVDAHRRSRRQKYGDPEVLGMATSQVSDDPREMAVERELRGRVDDLLNELRVEHPDRYAAFVMYTDENRGYAEIADILGIAEGTVKSHIFRARLFLQDRLRTTEPLHPRPQPGEHDRPD